MDNTLWIVVSFVIGFAILAILASVTSGIPDMATGFFEGFSEGLV